MIAKIKDFDQNVRNVGRIACVGMESKMDALAVYAGKIQLKLPLNDGEDGVPSVYPSADFAKWVQGFDLSAEEEEIKTSKDGVYFKEVDRQIREQERKLKDMERRYYKQGRRY